MAAGVWSIDLSEDDPQISRLYAGGVSTLQSESGEAYVLHPSACAVKEGLLYVVEERLDFSGSLAVYNLTDESMSLSAVALNVSAEAIVAAQYRYLFISSWADSGGLWVLDGHDPQGVFELVVADLGMVGPLCIGPDRVIVISVVDSGEIHFLRWQDEIEHPEPESTLTPTTTTAGGVEFPQHVPALVFAICSALFLH